MLQDIYFEDELILVSSNNIQIEGHNFYTKEIEEVQIRRLWPKQFYIYSCLSGIICGTVIWLSYVFVMTTGSDDLTLSEASSVGICLGFGVIPAFIYLAAKRQQWIAFLLSLTVALIAGNFFAPQLTGLRLADLDLADTPTIILILLFIFILAGTVTITKTIGMAQGYIQHLHLHGVFGDFDIVVSTDTTYVRHVTCKVMPM